MFTDCIDSQGKFVPLTEEIKNPHKKNPQQKQTCNETISSATHLPPFNFLALIC